MSGRASGTLHLKWRAGDPPALLRDREWLTCNGLGGFASGALLGIPTRRYHGILVPNLAQPKGRHIMLSRLDERVLAGSCTARLSGAQFLDGGVESDCHAYLTEFSLQWQVPTWTFEIAGRRLRKTILMPHRQNTVCVSYELLDGPAVTVELRPCTAFRRQDAPLNRDMPRCRLASEHGGHELCLEGSELAVRFGMQVPSEFVEQPHHESNVYYHIEHERGYDAAEDLFCPGTLRFELAPGAPAAFVATTEEWPALRLDTEDLHAGQVHRAQKLLELAPIADGDELAASLVLAADQFIVLPRSRDEESVMAAAAGDDVRTVIAGYHWFGDWGRDTMIALEGLTLCTGRHREARAILQTFAGYVRDGLLPNLFPEGESEGLYHTVDATLWYLHAIDRHAVRTGDRSLVEDLYPLLADIIAHHLRGTRFGIGMDPADGLLRAGAPGYQLTWMDAKVDDWVVTPRRGKPVEIQALWYNALCLMADWARTLGSSPGEYEQLATRVRESFNARFWNQDEACLFDVVDGEGGDDASVRPNQLLAISLRHPVLEQRRWRSVMEKVTEKLLTPFGLRTLSPEDPKYQRNYHGDLRTRDNAYHQGTVWPWLIGPFVDAWLRVQGSPAGARALLASFPQHLLDAGVGSISEIFDAERPYLPRGCIAQAWSVAEVLRAWTLAGSAARRDAAFSDKTVAAGA